MFKNFFGKIGLVLIIALIFNFTLNMGKVWSEELLKVMTFNLRYGTAPDGPNHWNNRKELVVKLIREYNPDLIGTQECLDFQAKYIVEQLPEYGVVGKGREKDGSGEQTAVFFRKDRWEVLEEKYFWISEAQEEAGSKSWDSACPRIVTWLKLKYMPSGKLIEYFNTHLDHRGEIARQKGAQIITQKIKDVSADESIFIITGDFNAIGDTSVTWKIFNEAGLKDAWVEAKDRKGPTSTWCGFRPPDSNSIQRIDWILYKGNIESVTCETIVYEENGRFPSDHFPVMAIFKIR